MTEKERRRMHENVAKVRAIIAKNRAEALERAATKHVVEVPEWAKAATKEERITNLKSELLKQFRARPRPAHVRRMKEEHPWMTEEEADAIGCDGTMSDTMSDEDLVDFVVDSALCGSAVLAMVRFAARKGDAG